MTEQDNPLTETRIIELQNGNKLDIECSTDFLECVKKQFNLDAEPTDEDIRMFFYGSFKSAIEKID